MVNSALYCHFKCIRRLAHIATDSCVRVFQNDCNLNLYRVATFWFGLNTPAASLVPKHFCLRLIRLLVLEGCTQRRSSCRSIILGAGSSLPHPSTSCTPGSRSSSTVHDSTTIRPSSHASACELVPSPSTSLWCSTSCRLSSRGSREHSPAACNYTGINVHTTQ